MIVAGALIGYTILFSLLLNPIAATFGKPAVAMIALVGFIFGWFAIIGISINVDQRRSLRAKILKEGFLGGMQMLWIWIGFMALLLAAGVVLAISGH